MVYESHGREGEVKREVNELSLLYEVSQALGKSMDIREVVGPVLNTLAEKMGMTRGTLALLNRKTSEMYIEVAHGLSESQRKRGRYQSGEGVIGKVVKTGQPVIVPHISDEPLFSTGPVREKTSAGRISPLYACPSK